MAPVLLGRSRELSALADAVETVAGGTGRVVHITGEAGIGKSSLLAAGTNELDRLGVTQRHCTVDETDRRRRLALVRALLPEIDRHPDPDPVGAVVAAAERLAAAGPMALVADDVHWADEESLDGLRALAIRAGTLGILLLTAAEQTIVSLVGEGLTNTEIGQRLYISRRTVESHLGRVDGKLGLGTRGQLVSAAVRHAAGDDG